MSKGIYRFRRDPGLAPAEFEKRAAKADGFKQTDIKVWAIPDLLTQERVLLVQAGPGTQVHIGEASGEEQLSKIQENSTNLDHAELALISWSEQAPTLPPGISLALCASLHKEDGWDEMQLRWITERELMAHGHCVPEPGWCERKRWELYLRRCGYVLTVTGDALSECGKQVGLAGARFLVEAGPHILVAAVEMAAQSCR